MRYTAVITGATGGLGKAFTWEFASRGWDLILTDRSSTALALLSCGVERAHGISVRCMTCDLSVDSERARLVEALQDENSTIGALVNVAGFDSEGAFIDRKPDLLVRMMRVNMEAGLVLTHALAKAGARTEPLRVINTASLAAFYPMPYKATYAASKGFILSTSLALREELRGRATITVLCPAGMPTTPSARAAIEAQGVIGRLTTMNTSDVVRVAVSAAMRGKPVVVPGILNQSLLAISGFLPRRRLATIVARRWGDAGGYTESPPVRMTRLLRRAS